MHSNLPWKCLWEIWSNSEVIPNFEVGPALSKSLDQVEVPSNQNYPVVLWQIGAGSDTDTLDISTKRGCMRWQGHWSSLSYMYFVLLWFCNVFRITLTSPEQLFQIAWSVIVFCIPPRIWTITTGQVTSVDCHLCSEILQGRCGLRAPPGTPFLLQA